MEEYTLLKLLWSQFSTKQIHQLLKTFPEFLKCSKKEQHDLLCSCPFQKPNSSLQSKITQYISTNIDEIMTYFRQFSIQYTSVFSETYPKMLKETYNYPFILFYQGNIDLCNNSNTLAVVGSRQATQYTTDALEYLFSSFKLMNLHIVSGLAHGADSIAHQVALKYHLPTIAVLGFGHAYHYPQSTLKLRHQIREQGLILSEYPPLSPIAKYKFPERNRIISGLSKGVLITEAKRQSGSHITVDCALEQNRNVYVLPGSMFNQMTVGNLKLLQQGAKVVLEPQDILEDYFF